MNEAVVRPGQIKKIIVPSRSSEKPENARVLIEEFVIEDTRDERMNMPVLTPHSELDGVFRFLEPKVRCHYSWFMKCTEINLCQDILFIFNVQHDCRSANCTMADHYMMQERQLTSRTQSVITHGPLRRFFLNMHALHNAALIRETLPRHLTKPIPYFEDRHAKHLEFAAQLQVSGPIKRAGAQAKAAETRARNKKADKGAPQAAEDRTALAGPSTG